MSRIGEFQPPDVEEDRDAMEEAWETRLRFAVGMTTEEAKDYIARRLDSAASDGYAEGRKDEREALFADMNKAIAERPVRDCDSIEVRLQCAAWNECRAAVLSALGGT